MKTVKLEERIPTYNTTLKTSWTAIAVEKNPEYTPWNHELPYKSEQILLRDLLKRDGYKQFIPKFNWLYKNYSAQNYSLVWSELRRYNDVRRQNIQIKAADDIMNYYVEQRCQCFKEGIGEFPKFIERLTDEQRVYYLDRARVLYDLEPRYDLCTVVTKDVYTLIPRVVKDTREGEDGDYPIYYTEKELTDAGIPTEYQILVGRCKIISQRLRRCAEDVVLTMAAWMAQFNGTESDLRSMREVEGDAEHNRMVPRTTVYNDNGELDESSTDLDVEFRDFLTPLYEEGDE